MKKYYIQSRVRTWSEILSKYTHDENEKDVNKRFKSEFEFGWFHFEQWDFSVAQWALGDAWLLKLEIWANNFSEAVNIYLKKLNNILPRIFFSVPVWHSFGFHESLLVSNDNFSSGFYFLRKEREWTWLVITDEILEIIKNQDFKNIPDNFLIYYSEFINSNTALSWLSLWLSALEVIRPQDNKKRIKLFWEELYYKIYGKIDKNFPERKEWIRHKIHHGKYPSEWDNMNLDFDVMNEAIRLCLIEINPEIQKIYDLRSRFRDIPRSRKVIEWFNWVYLFRKKPKLDLREIVKYDETRMFEFLRKLKVDLDVDSDTNILPENY